MAARFRHRLRSRPAAPDRLNPAPAEDDRPARRKRKPRHFDLRAAGGKVKTRADRRPRLPYDTPPAPHYDGPQRFQVGGIVGALARGLAGIVGDAELAEAGPAVAWAAGSGVRHAVKKHRNDDDDDDDD